MKLFFAILFLVKLAQADFASELLEASDQGRGGIKQGIEWKGQVQSFENGNETNREFLIKAKDHDALVEAISPAKNKGEVFIFNDRQMWFFKPSLKKPVSISARQKLSGQAANGDIASTHYARDYNATLEKTEIVDGEKHHVLLLKAKSSNLTYDQIRYWINDKTKLAMKAEFLTLQGKAFKFGYLEYKNKLELGNKKIPFVSQLTIVDAKYENNKSILKYSNPRTANHPAAIFNSNNMTR